MITIEVKRHRQSVTQGEAEVFINGKSIVRFGDTIEIIEPGNVYYGELIGNWASTKPDSDFIHGVFNHPYEEIYHYSEPAYKTIKQTDAPKIRRI